MTEGFSRREFLGAGALVAGSLVLGARGFAADAKAKRTVVVWSEGTAPKDIYPKDINSCIAEGLTGKLEGWNVVVASLSDPDQGLNDELLAKCDVLMWWGHKKHGDVKDALVQKIVKRVKEEGMGFIGLHSAHFAKPNIKLMEQMETKKELLEKVQPKGRVAAWGGYKSDITKTTVRVKEAAHPIAEGIKEFTVENAERYCDPYAVPAAKSVVFDGVSALKNGTTDTSELGFTWEIGKGKMFYFQLGHETNPIFKDENIQKIMLNAVKWAAK